jgi:hypothetical protein
MKRRDDVERFLDSIAEYGNRVQFAAVPLQSGIGDVQIIVYPAIGEADVRVFHMLDGLTPSVQKSIRDWFEPFARSGSVKPSKP